MERRYDSESEHSRFGSASGYRYESDYPSTVEERIPAASSSKQQQSLAAGYESYASDGATTTTLEDYYRKVPGSVGGYSSGGANQFSTPTPTEDFPLKMAPKRQDSGSQDFKRKTPVDLYDMPASTSYDRVQRSEERRVRERVLRLV